MVSGKSTGLAKRKSLKVVIRPFDVVIPSAARNLSVQKANKEGFLAALGMTRAIIFRHLVKLNTALGVRALGRILYACSR